MKTTNQNPASATKVKMEPYVSIDRDERDVVLGGSKVRHAGALGMPRPDRDGKLRSR